MYISFIISLSICLVLSPPPPPPPPDSLFSTQKLYPKELNATVLVSASNFDKRGQHLYSVEMFSCRDKTSPAAGATQSE